jgi:hypothetical protein
MELESAGELARTGKAYAGGELVTENSEDDLGDDLLADRDLAGVDEPEAHGGWPVTGYVGR